MYVFSHNDSWSKTFEEEVARLRSVAKIKIGLHHIGSTSIKGLWAKNCVDILGVIDSFDEGNKLVQSFVDLGYSYKGEYGISGRHYFSKTSDPKIHLHVLPQSHCQISRHFHFQDVMRARPDLIQELNDLKREVSAKYPKDIYQRQKEPFYEKVGKIKL